MKVNFSDFWVVGWKFTKFLKPYLKPQVSFSLDFAPLLSVMRDNPSIFFSWKFVWFGQKKPIKVQNIRLSTTHVKFHQICTLIGSFYWKYIKLPLYHDIKKSDIKFDKKPVCSVKNDKNLANFDLSTQKSQKYTLWLVFCAKYITFDIKKYRGVIFHETEEQNLKKNWLVVEKRHEEFGKFSPQHLEMSKSRLWRDPFVQSRKCMS